MTCYDILGIAASNTHEGYMWSFLRVVLMLASFTRVEATTGWQRREANPWDFLSLKMENFVNPLHEGLQNKMKFMWHEATLAPLLDRITHFVTLGSKNSINEIDIPSINGQVKWLAQRSALNISELGKSFLFLSLSVYAGSLLLRMLHQRYKDGDTPDINYDSYAKELADSPRDKLPELIEEIKQKERDMEKIPLVTTDPIFSSQVSLTLFLHFSSFFWGEFLHGPSRGAGSPSGADGNTERLELHNM